VFQLLHLLILLGLILAIVAGVDTVSSSASTQSTGRSLRKAASIILLLVVILICAIVLRLAAKIRSVLPADHILVWCALISMPFLFVRLILFVLEGFSTSSMFNPLALNIYIQAFMQVLMEFIAIGLYITSGLLAPVMDNSLYAGEDSELLPTTSRNSYRSKGPQQSQYTGPRN
jgi:hypothetical protein